MKQRNPLMAEAILSDDIELLRGLLREQKQARDEESRKRSEEIVSFHFTKCNDFTILHFLKQIFVWKFIN